MLEPFDPRTVSRSEFVEGPDGDVKVDIHPVFAKELGTILADLRADDPDALDVGDDAVVTVSALDRDVSFVGVDAGVLMVSGGEIVGAYLGFDVAVEGSWRGRGLGSELILERAMRDGGVPQWEASKIGYSPDGYRAHETAWELAGDRELFARKAARLIVADMKASDGSSDEEVRERLAVPAKWSAEDWATDAIRERGLDAFLAGVRAAPPAP